MKIIDFLKEESVLINLQGKTKREALSELLNVLKSKNYIKNSSEILDIVLEREKLGSTGIGQGIAVPHAKTDQIEKLVGAVGISENGVSFDSLDGEPVNIIFLILAPTKSIGEHLKALAKIARLLKNRTFRTALRNSKTASEAMQIIIEDDEKLSSTT